jgi:ATP-dependent DNA helicase RecG
MERFEGTTTEFKREYTEGLKKTIAAFANTGGGALYIGINDDGTAAGLENPDDVILRVSDAVRSGIRPDLSLFVDYTTEILEGKAVVKVMVQKGTAPPYYLAGKGIRPEGVYVRQGAASVPAGEGAILRMIREAGGESYEAARSSNQDLSFQAAEAFFAARSIPFGPPQRKSLRLQSPGGDYSNLALILSDQSPHTVKLAVFEGLEKEIFRDRREFSGSLLGQLEEAYGVLDRYNGLHGEVQGLYRLDTRDYPEDALREALLNAMVHRDYGFPGSILISIFDDRVEFVSLGGLVKGLSLEDIRLGVSVPRNENLAAIFYRLKLIEAYGTGIPKIFRAYAGFPRQPFLQASGNAFKITLPNRNAAGTLAAERPPAFAFSGGALRGSSLTENEEKAKVLLGNRPLITRRDLEAALAVSQPMAVRVLRGLVDKGFLQVLGAGKNTRYRWRANVS